MSSNSYRQGDGRALDCAAHDNGPIARITEPERKYDTLSDAAVSNGSDDRLNRSSSSLMHRLGRIVPHGGIISNVYTLASATLGAGIVTMPNGFYMSGLAMSIILLVVVCMTTIYSLRLLVIAKERTGFRSYEELAVGLFGRFWGYVAAFLMFMFCWGTCIGYVVSIRDLITPMLNSPNVSDFFQTNTGNAVVTTMIWFVGMFTLSLPKQINSLRHVSVVGVSFICFFVILVIVHSAQNGLRHGIRSDIILFNSGMNAVNGLTLFIFAFICQVNVFEIYEESHKPSPRKMTRDSAISMSCVALLNLFAGIFGYLDYGAGVPSSLLLAYDPRNSWLFMLAYIGICIKLCVGFAICIQPSRDAVYYCFNMGKTSDVNRWVNWIVSSILSIGALLCGLLIPNITIVFTLLGGICGGFLGFLFPAFFYMYCGNFTLEREGWLNFLGCGVLIISGVVAVIFGTAASIYFMID